MLSATIGATRRDKEDLTNLMLDKLFRRLTGAPADDANLLFDMLTGEARQPHWYLEGGVPDTIDGRFAVLATLTALALVRLESDGDAGDRLSAALTGRFAEVMDSEHRELGLGEPTLGKTVLKMVGSLAGRVELWRSLDPSAPEWNAATKRSLQLDKAPDNALRHSAESLARFHARIQRTAIDQLREGKAA